MYGNYSNSLNRVSWALKAPRDSFVTTNTRHNYVFIVRDTTFGMGRRRTLFNVEPLRLTPRQKSIGVNLRHANPWYFVK